MRQRNGQTSASSKQHLGEKHVVNLLKSTEETLHLDRRRSAEDGVRGCREVSGANTVCCVQLRFGRQHGLPSPTSPGRVYSCAAHTLEVSTRAVGKKKLSSWFQSSTQSDPSKSEPRRVEKARRSVTRAPRMKREFRSSLYVIPPPRCSPTHVPNGTSLDFHPHPTTP